MTNPLTELARFGQSPWYDNIARAMLSSGELQRMISEDGLKGVTSNPTIFEKAIAGSKDYDQAIIELITSGKVTDSEQVFFHLAVEDIRAATDLFRNVYEQSDGLDGMVSLEVSPTLAYDTQATIRQALELRRWVDRPNVMIKVPATLQGIPAVEALVAEGVNVNVTLLFSVARYELAALAYIRGLQQRAARGLEIHRVNSVASFFVSRVDSAVDKLIEAKLKQQPAAELQQLLGKAAVANAKAAYALYQKVFSGDAWNRLSAAGGRPQRLLWASTGTKNPSYSDVMYIEELIGEFTVNTIPPDTYKAFKEHGKAAPRLHGNTEQAIACLKELEKYGIDLNSVTTELESKGVESFSQSFQSLLKVIEKEMLTMRTRVG